MVRVKRTKNTNPFSVAYSLTPQLPGLSHGLFPGPPFKQPHGSPQIINIYSVTGGGEGVDTRTWLPALPSLLCIPVVGFNFCRRDWFSHWRILSLSRLRNSSMLFLSITVWSLIMATVQGCRLYTWSCLSQIGDWCDIRHLILFQSLMVWRQSKWKT